MTILELNKIVNALSSRLNELQKKVDSNARPEFIDVIQVDKTTPTIIGRYRASAEHIVLRLDASLGSFSVQLPSMKDQKNIIFIVKKIDETSNTVTFAAQAGEYIHDTGVKSASLVVTTSAPVNMVSDRVDSWLVAG